MTLTSSPSLWASTCTAPPLLLPASSPAASCEACTVSSRREEMPVKRLVSETIAVSVCCRELSTRSEEHTSELQSLMRTSYAVFCLKKKNKNKHKQHILRQLVR